MQPSHFTFLNSVNQLYLHVCESVQCFSVLWKTVEYLILPMELLIIYRLQEEVMLNVNYVHSKSLMWTVWCKFRSELKHGPHWYSVCIWTTDRFSLLGNMQMLEYYNTAKLCSMNEVTDLDAIWAGKIEHENYFDISIH